MKFRITQAQFQAFRLVCKKLNLSTKSIRLDKKLLAKHCMLMYKRHFVIAKSYHLKQTPKSSVLVLNFAFKVVGYCPYKKKMNKKMKWRKLVARSLRKSGKLKSSGKKSIKKSSETNNNNEEKNVASIVNERPPIDVETSDDNDDDVEIIENILTINVPDSRTPSPQPSTSREIRKADKVIKVEKETIQIVKTENAECDIRNKLEERLRVLEQSTPEKPPVLEDIEDDEIDMFQKLYYNDSDVEEQLEDMIEVSNTEIRDHSGAMVTPKDEPEEQQPCCSKSLKAEDIREELELSKWINV